MQLRMLLGTTVGVALLTSSGCLIDRPYEPGVDGRFPLDERDAPASASVDPADDPSVSAAIPFLGVRDGLMKGDVGPARRINQTPDRLAIYDDGYFLSVESVAQLNDRAAMLMLSASNAGDLFVAGTNRTFSSVDYEADGAQVYLLGCTGQQVDVYDEYDVPATEVDLEVTEGSDVEAGEVLVQVTGRWNQTDELGEITGTQTATARFSLQH